MKKLLLLVVFLTACSSDSATNTAADKQKVEAERQVLFAEIQTCVDKAYPGRKVIAIKDDGSSKYYVVLDSGKVVYLGRAEFETVTGERVTHIYRPVPEKRCDDEPEYDEGMAYDDRY